MSISSITPASLFSSDPSSLQSVKTRVQQDFAQIAQSLQTNDLAGAQKAYADVVQLTPAGSSTARNPVQSDVANLGKALQSGDLSGAQSAFSQLKTDLSTARHHGHHRHAEPAAYDADNAAVTPAPPAATGSGFLGTLAKTALSLLG